MTDPRSLALPDRAQSTELAQQWRVLARAATFVAILTSPAAFVYLHKQQGWSLGWSIAGAIFLVAAFRGFIDLVLRRFLPWPSLFGTEDARLRDEDVSTAAAPRSGASRGGSSAPSWCSSCS